MFRNHCPDYFRGPCWAASRSRLRPARRADRQYMIFSDPAPGGPARQYSRGGSQPTKPRREEEVPELPQGRSVADTQPSAAGQGIPAPGGVNRNLCRPAGPAPPSFRQNTQPAIGGGASAQTGDRVSAVQPPGAPLRGMPPGTAPAQGPCRNRRAHAAAWRRGGFRNRRAQEESSNKKASFPEPSTDYRGAHQKLRWEDIGEDRPVQAR